MEYIIHDNGITLILSTTHLSTYSTLYTCYDVTIENEPLFLGKVITNYLDVAIDYFMQKRRN